MFGLRIPDEFIKGLKGKAKEKTIDDAEIDSFWRDSHDDSIWRVTYKDDRIHIVSSIGQILRVHGVNLFFEAYTLVEYGAICISCKKESPYAEKRAGFKCWACKNGC